MKTNCMRCQSVGIAGEAFGFFGRRCLVMVAFQRT
jgi:hypothetical protein